MSKYQCGIAELDYEIPELEGNKNYLNSSAVPAAHDAQAAPAALAAPAASYNPLINRS